MPKNLYIFCIFCIPNLSFLPKSQKSRNYQSIAVSINNSLLIYLRSNVQEAIGYSLMILQFHFQFQFYQVLQCENQIYRLTRTLTKFDRVIHSESFV